MDFVVERTQKIMEALWAQRNVQTVKLDHWDYKKGFFTRPEEADASPDAYEPFDTASMRWGGFDEHGWFRLSFCVPESFDGRPLWLTVETELDGWDATNPQFLAFLDGVPLQGLDTNHRDILLTQSARGAALMRVDLQAYSGRFEGGRRLIATLAEMDPAAYGLYWDLAVPVRIAEKLDRDDHIRLQLENILTRAVNLIDLREKNSPAFRASLGSASACLERALYTDLAGKSETVATCVGHTHIDVAWQWTVAQTREKAARSFATVLKLMDEYPEYKFMSSQPQLYSFVKERYPEMYERIRQRVREGRWEAEGGMWLEADCNLTSGESLARQLLYGKRFFREEFGVDSRIVWLPDVFGYSAALPQIMKKAGIDYFMTTKIAWNQFNKLPCDTFWWRGIDGTEIFTHLITAKDPDQPKESFFTTYNGKLHPGALIGGWERYQQKALNNDILIAYGWGDGGGGTTREMIENGLRLQKGLPGCPRVRMETSRTYFDQLYEKLHENPRLPRWDGELYLEYHRGTYTSMARNKRDNRLCELRLRDAELLAVWTGLLGCAYPQETLRRSWETVLLNQFHDILPGSSIREVYDVTREEYAAVLRDTRAIITETLDVLAENARAAQPSLLLVNTLSFPRTDIAVTSESVDGLTDAQGAPIPCQKTFDGKTALRITNLPAMGCAAFPLSDAPPEEAADLPLTVRDQSASGGTHTVENAFYRAEMDSNGRLVRLWDHRAQREVLAGPGNILRVYEDRPMCFDNWDIDIYHKEKYWDVEELVSGRWIESGPVRAVYEAVHRFLHSDIRQRVIFYAHTSRIDFDTWVDWKQSQLLMKALFPVQINASQATYDIQFGNVQRPTHCNTSWDAARFETCAHKWADLSEDGFGVSLLNNCKYGYDIHEGVMALTLIKSGIEPNPATDQEEHRFTYALYPHAGTWRDGGTQEEAEMLNAPLYARRLAGKEVSADEPCSLFSLGFGRAHDNHVMIDAVKRAEDGDGVILRMHEYKNRRGTVRVESLAKICGAVECTLLEEPLNTLETQERAFAFTIKPYEIKTFRLLMEPLQRL